LAAIECTEKINPNQKEFKFYLYPAFMVISTIFLILTLFAYFVSPAWNNLQGKSIACQSGTLAVSLVAYTVVHLFGDTTSAMICKIAGNKTTLFENVVCNIFFCALSLHRSHIYAVFILLAEFNVF
jgi:hypothetical protein